MPKSLFAAFLALGVTLAGCGGAHRKARGVPNPAASALLTPQRADCAADRLATSHQPQDRVPKPGTYRYRLTGTQRLVGAGPRTLRGDMTVTVTAALHLNRLRCYRVRRALANDIADTATLVVRGNRVYITQLQSTLGGQQTLLMPDPPVLALDPDRLRWEGTFSGVSSGRYRAEPVGRRRFDIGGRPVRALGVRFTLVSTGEVSGTQRSLQWFDPRSNLVVREEVEQRRSFGVDELLLDYRARARALTPTR